MHSLTSVYTSNEYMSIVKFLFLAAVSLIRTVLIISVCFITSRSGKLLNCQQNYLSVQRRDSFHFLNQMSNVFEVFLF